MNRPGILFPEIGTHASILLARDTLAYLITSRAVRSRER